MIRQITSYAFAEGAAFALILRRLDRGKQCYLGCRPGYTGRGERSHCDCVFVNVCVFLIRERVNSHSPFPQFLTDTYDDDDYDKITGSDGGKYSEHLALSPHPMKNDATEAALGLLNLAEAANHFSTVPSKRAAPQDDEQPHVAGSDSINCICGYTFDDGFSIACDDCSRWCHAACFQIVQGGVPEEWRCWVCAPRPVDRERAVRLQTQRKQDAIRAENEKRRRQTSPGVERKPRRQGALAIDGSNPRRKRRASVNVHPTGEDEHVTIDEPWVQSYIPIFRDIVPHQEARDNLRSQAKHWRGVSALSPPPNPPGPLDSSPVVLSTSPPPTQTSIRPLPHSSFSHPILSSHTNPSVLPPSYAMHTTQSIPSSKFITPYTSTIIPSSAYLSDPLNAYAHHGMPKPFVHLFGPPLDVALDARITGNEARFVRSGCRPNAVLRPVICPRAKGSDEHDPSSKRSDSETLTFAVFALRDIKPNEEVVLGWEWDDGNAVHHLPALIETPHLFEYVVCSPCFSYTFDHFRSQGTSSPLHSQSNAIYATRAQLYLHHVCMRFQSQRLCPQPHGRIC